MTRRRFWLAVALAAGVGLTLRLLRLHLDVANDEAWYFHLARTLAGAGRNVTPVQPQLAHLILRPVLYLFYWPVAQLGLTGARLVNVALGTFTTVYLAVLCRRLGVRPWPAALAAWIVAFQQITCNYSVFLYPDSLATALLLPAIASFVAGRRGATLALFTLCLLTKEMFAVVPLALVPLSLERGGRLGWRPGPMTPVLLLPLVPVAAVTLVATFGLGAHMQGWATEKPTALFWLAHLLPALLVAWPILVVARRRLELVLSLAFPVFFVLWSYVRGAGVSDWYLYGPLHLSALAIVAAADEAGRRVRARRPPRLAMVAGAVAAALVAAVIVRKIVVWNRALVGDDVLATPETVAVAEEVAARRPTRLVLVDCFWAFSYFPFATAGKEIAAVRATDPLPDADVIVAALHGAALEERLAPCLVLTPKRYRVYADLEACRTK
jgi:hypothetical protein